MNKQTENEQAAWVVVFLASLAGSAARITSNAAAHSDDAGNTAVTAARIADAALQLLKMRGISLMETFK